MDTQIFDVEGMTCAHCAAAVTREVRGIEGIEDVAVDVAAGTVAVTGALLDEPAIAAAVSEAGYRLVGRR